MLVPASIPNWFQGKDAIIDFVSIFVLVLVSYFSVKYYKIKKNKNNLSLTLAFSLLIASFTFKILITLGIYYNFLGMSHLGFGKLTISNFRSLDTFVFLMYFTYRIITLFGLYHLYRIYKPQSKSCFFLASYLMVVSTFFAHYANFIFHLSAFVILLLITLHSIERYKKKKYPSTKLLIYSFGLITISQLFYTMMEIGMVYYIIAEFVQLFGYVGLLLTFIAVLIHGGKKNETRYHW